MAPRKVTRWPAKTSSTCKGDLIVAPVRQGNRDLDLARRERAAGYRQCSGPKEHEPDEAQDQHREAGRDCKQGKHRRARFGLACFGRGFDDLIVFSGCHRTSFVSVCDAGDTTRKQRMIGNDVPDFGAARAGPNRLKAKPFEGQTT